MFLYLSKIKKMCEKELRCRRDPRRFTANTKGGIDGSSKAVSDRKVEICRWQKYSKRMAYFTPNFSRIPRWIFFVLDLMRATCHSSHSRLNLWIAVSVTLIFFFFFLFSSFILFLSFFFSLNFFYLLDCKFSFFEFFIIISDNHYFLHIFRNIFRKIRIRWPVFQFWKWQQWNLHL